MRVEDRTRSRAPFDPVVEGARYGLSPAQAEAVWVRACGDRDGAAAQLRFHELAATVGRGGQLRPEIGRTTRVIADAPAPRGPGRSSMSERAASTASSVETDANANANNAARKPLAETTSPVEAFAALAVHTVAAAAQRTFGATKLAASGDGAGPTTLDDRPDILRVLELAAADPGQALPQTLRAQLEHELGRSLAHVRIHAGAAANAAARAIHARAFTLGSHIYFADGELAPGSERGDRLLRHELTHVIQHDEGRLHSRGGGLEVEHPDSDAEREARAAEHAPARATIHSLFGARHTAAPHPASPAPSPAPHAPRPTQPADVRSGAIGRNILDDAGNWVRDRAGDVASWGADQFIRVVRQISPQLASLIERGPGAVVSGELTTALGSLLGGLLPPNPLGALLGFGAGMIDFGSTLLGAANGDAGCCATFAMWCEKLGALARKAARSDFVNQIKAAFSAVDQALAGILRLFGGGLVEAFRGQLQFLDTMGSWIASGVRAIAAYLQPAADWVLKQLGLPSLERISTWLRDLAQRAWTVVQQAASTGLALLRTVGAKLIEFSGLGAIIEAFRFGAQLIEVTDWLIAHRNDPNLVRNAREQMAHTFLPKLIERTGGLVTRVQAMYQWVASHLTEIGLAVGAAALAMTGVLLPLAAILVPLAAALRQLWPRIEPALRQLWTSLETMARRIYDYARPVIATFTQLGLLITAPWLLPQILISSAWLLLPDCFKAPILNLILDLMIAALDALPDSAVQFGPLWRFVKAGALGFLHQVRTSWKDAEKVTVINRLAGMASGRSPEMLAGFVVGFAKGLIAGVLDPFKMIYDILKLGVQLTVFLARLVNQAPQLAAVIQRHLPALEAHAQRLQAMGQQALDDFLHGRITFDDLWRMITSFGDAIAAKAGSLGATVADKLKTFFTSAGSEYSIGEAIGIAIGFIIVFALLVYFSGGAFAEARGIVGVVAQIARILNMPYELLGAALRPLAKLFAPAIEALAALGARLGLRGAWTGAMRAFEGLSTTLGRLVEDLLIVLERRVVGHTAEEIASILARRVGQELAERLVAQLGGEAAERVVAQLGESTTRRLSSLSADALLQLSTRLDSAVINRMLDRGWSAAAIERLGLTLERPVLDSMVASLTGAQAERLAALGATKLQGATAATLQRLAALPEAQLTRLGALGDAGFRRMVALPDAQFRRFMALGDEQLRVFSEMSDAAFARFSALGDTQLARFSAMPAVDLQRFAGLTDGAFQRFATATDAVFAKFAALEPAALERFGSLSQPAFDRFAALEASAIEKFSGVTGPQLERFATAANFDVFAQAERATIEKFAAVNQATFDRFASPRFDLATLNRLGGAEAATLENLATWPNGRAFNVAVRNLTAAELDVIGKLSAAEAERIASLAGRAEENFRLFGSLDAGLVQNLLGITDNALLSKFSQLTSAELRGFSGLTTGELQSLASLAPEALGRFGAIGDAAALRNFAALTPQQLAHYAPLTTTQLQVWGQVAPTTLARFAPMEGALANFADAVPAAVLDRLATELSPAALRELALVDAAGIRRISALPAADLAKLNGLSGFELQRAAQLPAGELERIAASGGEAEVRAALQGDAAAERRAAEALDGPPGAHTGHGHADHGAQTTAADQENRLRTGTTPSGRTTDPLGNPLTAPPEAGRWASDAVQNHAAQLAEAQLPAEIAARPSTHPRGRYTLEINLQGAGYSYRLEGGALAERQANRFTITYEPRIQPPVIPPSTNPNDYVIITMFPI